MLKQNLVEIIIRHMDIYFERNDDFGPIALGAAEEILKSQPFRRIRGALEEIDSIIDCTFDHDEDGERIDEQGEHSAADIVEMLSNAELKVSEAIEIVGPSEPLSCDATDDEVALTCDLCGKVELEGDAIDSGWIPCYWKGETQILNPVCRECATARTKCLDGESVLIEEPAQPSSVNAELLDALHDCLEIVKDEYAEDSEPEDLPSWKRAIDKAEAAIAKATGNQ